MKVYPDRVCRKGLKRGGRKEDVQLGDDILIGCASWDWPHVCMFTSCVWCVVGM